MAELSRSTVDPGMVTMQCDICCPPAIATSQESLLRANGWALRSHGDAVDSCTWCTREAPQGRKLRTTRAAEVPAETGHLPNAFIIGTAKAGTTSLHEWISTHPEIFGAELKELQYFQDPDHESWTSLYRAQFPEDAPVRLESSTMYTRSPAIPGVAARIAAMVPDARLIYLVRDPVSRALASYREERFQLLDTRSVEEAFTDADPDYNPYLAASRYAEQLDEYLEHFPREQILVLSLSELRDEPDKTLRRVFEHLGVDPTFQVDTGVRHNEGAAKTEYSKLGHWLRFSILGILVRRMPPWLRRILTWPARKFLRREMETPELPDEVHERIRELLRADAERFRHLTGMTFDEWIV